MDKMTRDRVKGASSVKSGYMWVLVDRAPASPRFEVIQVPKTFNYPDNWRFVERSGRRGPVEATKRYLESVRGK